MDEPARAGSPVTPHADGIALCEAGRLLERGQAYVFDVMHLRQPARAFALRFDGRLVGYINQCVHVPAEMDWLPGEFLDSDKRFIMCSIHGAVYEPLSGRCVGGPCGRGRLTPIDVSERAGQVYWYPSPDVQPASAAATRPEAPKFP
jgi:nitrite reductase/ring-hydroxylating ferredoxin subunit